MQRNPEKEIQESRKNIEEGDFKCHLKCTVWCTIWFFMIYMMDIFLLTVL